MLFDECNPRREKISQFQPFLRFYVDYVVCVKRLVKKMMFQPFLRFYGY